jgi:hypothetical protein
METPPADEKPTMEMTVVIEKAEGDETASAATTQRRMDKTEKPAAEYEADEVEVEMEAGAKLAFDTDEEEAYEGPMRLFRTLLTHPTLRPPPPPRSSTGCGGASHNNNNNNNKTTPQFFMAPPPLGRVAPPPYETLQPPYEVDGPLRAWLENELAGPLRFNVSLTRELVEAQRRSDYLLSENNLLRRRAEERVQVHQELAQCQQRAVVASLSAVIQQQQLLLEQQQQLMGALKALAAGGDPPLRSTPI